MRIEPIETTIAWGLLAEKALDLGWSPSATIQSYIGYTNDLDERNRASIDIPEPIDAVIYQQLPKPWIPRWDSPGYQLDLICRFAPTGSDRTSTILIRRPKTACAPGRDLGSVRADIGSTLRLPDVGADELEVVTFETPSPDLPERIRTFLWKPQEVNVTFGPGDTRRFTPTTASRPHVVRYPECWKSSMGTIDTEPFTALSFEGPGPIAAHVSTLQVDCG